MKTVIKILSGVAVLALLAVVVAFFLPKSYRVERATVVQARPDAVFAHIGDLRAWRNWSAWHERDPGMKVSFSERSSGVGAWSAWESKTEGNGKMTFTAHEPPKRVVYTLEFPDMHMVSTGSMELRPEGQGVRVVWVTEGELGMNPVNRWFGVFLDKMIGPDFESGLAKLKKLAESPK